MTERKDTTYPPRPSWDYSDLEDPLPYSVFPTHLAPMVGAMTIAFQQIEDEVQSLLSSLMGLSEEMTEVITKRSWRLVDQVCMIRETTEITSSSEDQEPLQNLCAKLDELRTTRNQFIHSVTHATMDGGRQVMQIERRKRKARVYDEHGLWKLLHQMYLMVEALLRLRFGSDHWYLPLDHWDDPWAFWTPETEGEGTREA